MSARTGMAISQEIFNHLESILEPGKTILELGSGHGSELLLAKWNLISIEDNSKWVGKYHDRYIHAPLTEHKPIAGAPKSVLWYDREILKKELPKFDYDLLLVDGPAGYNRAGFAKYFSLFKQDVPILFDDMQRVQLLVTSTSVVWQTQRPITIYPQYPGNKNPKFYGVILA